jgi:LmbE family N-acetylglucosaminyl deacetylase
MKTMNSDKITSFESQIVEMKTVAVQDFGKSVVIAPHPDDETLGCGGTAALLMQMNIDVHFIFVSDGTLSHPNSQKYPSPRLRELREKEAIEAVKLLGGSKEDVTFLAMPDRWVPDEHSPYFEAAVRLFINMIAHFDPETVFIPWQNDPHPDHQASYQIVAETVARMEKKPRLLQYPIWLWEMGDVNDIELIQQMEMVCVDITSVLPVKLAALHAHQSQVSDLIDDDPEGFRLSPEVIAHFDHPREIFFKN